MTELSSGGAAGQITGKRAASSRGSAPGSLLASLWALYALTFLQHLHGRRWIVMTILFLLPPAIAILIRATAPDMPVVANEYIIAFMFIPQALLPLIALVYASGIIQDEQEEQTLTYLLIRPIPRAAIYVVKLLATLTTTVLLTSIFTALTYVVIYVGSDSSFSEILPRFVRATAIHGLAVVCYCCLFGVMSLLTRWALIVGALYALFFEVFVANLPFSIRLVTVIYYTRLIAYRSMEFVVHEIGRSEDIAAMLWQFELHDNDRSLPDYPSMRTCLIVLAVASLACTLIGALICARREFYVKTPEST